MANVIDLTGKSFGRLTVMSFDCVVDGNAKWNCSCACGALVTIHACSLKRGASKSCGCLKNELTAKVNFIHGESDKTKEFRAWSNMLNRCSNVNCKEYHYYGGRGITVCNRWRISYQNFLSDMGRAPSKKHSIDRVDNNKNYEPLNCKWSTNKEQANNKRSCLLIYFNGETKNLSQWCERLKLPFHTIKARIKHYGWTPEKALTKPVRHFKNI